jgi:hypothetical protein
MWKWRWERWKRLQRRVAWQPKHAQREEETTWLDLKERERLRCGREERQSACS